MRATSEARCCEQQQYCRYGEPCWRWDALGPAAAAFLGRGGLHLRHVLHEVPQKVEIGRCIDAPFAGQGGMASIAGESGVSVRKRTRTGTAAHAAHRSVGVTCFRPLVRASSAARSRRDCRKSSRARPVGWTPRGPAARLATSVVAAPYGPRRPRRLRAHTDGGRRRLGDLADVVVALHHPLDARLARGSGEPAPAEAVSGGANGRQARRARAAHRGETCRVTPRCRGRRSGRDVRGRRGRLLLRHGSVHEWLGSAPGKADCSCLPRSASWRRRWSSALHHSRQRGGSS